ncbi:hypothetical protein Pmani_007978 [Petrolisthes manimaculis]|uniref:Uncharacterized protein n=1 Tax=Petrolisthes manimaculis TaxID=1843537 RepID=A0AAE1Q7Q3_9EUCA|nr:hypothetical protein Pmani_007978 [Petrolisthes manimaculis]
MIWREPRDHVTDCYFCLTRVAGFTGKTRHLIAYPSLDSAIRPVPHSDDVPKPIFTQLASVESDSECDTEVTEESTNRNSDSDFGGISTEQQTFSQAELNDLVRDLGLSKKLSELLASRLKDKNLLKIDTIDTFASEKRISYSSLILNLTSSTVVIFLD